MADYDPNTPTGTQNLSVAQPKIQNNFSQLNTIFNSDHYSFDNTDISSRGLHKKVTFPGVLVSDPVNVDEQGCLYTKSVDAKTQLFFDNETQVYQLTGTNAWDSGKSQGTFVIGSLRIIFGSVLVNGITGGSTGVVVFDPAFSSVPYSATISASASGGALLDNTWVSDLTASGMTINQRGNPGMGDRTFYYNVIGPA